MFKIDFDEEKHEYTIDGEKIHSVSEIISPLTAERYSELNPYMVRAAAERGKMIHEACEAIDYGLELPELPPEAEGYVRAYLDFLRDYFPKWEMVEGVVAYQKDGKPLYAGTVDRYGYIDGSKSVVDIKTYASLTAESMMTASLQTELYRLAIDSMARMKRYILHLKKDGNYRLVDLDKFDKERGLHSYDFALTLHRLYDEKRAVLSARKKKKNEA